MIDRELMLYKLGNYGFDKLPIQLLSDYFKNRTQLIKIDEIQSQVTELLMGIIQDSCLGPLLFIIFIDDLPSFLKNLKAKLFADDTIMFINNKRVELPTFIELENQKIDVVDKVKLLGVMLDNKLKFDLFISQQCLAINRRLYQNKRSFFLPNDVKLVYFKAFILPCFDYCISLGIYLNSQNLQKLCKLYYFFIKLFKLNFLNLNANEINNLLEPYGIQAFEYRIISKIILFIAKISCNDSAPFEMKQAIQFDSQVNHSYNLRSNGEEIVAVSRVRSKYGDLMFKTFATKVINKFKTLNFFNNNFINFKKQLNNNLNISIDKFINLMPKFRLHVNFYFYIN